MVTEVLRPTKAKAGVWTQFWDMHSGGGLKEPPYHLIYIEAPEDEAIRIFEQRFGHDPLEVGCECCGSNYSITEYEDLAQATGYHRNCDWDPKRDGYVDKPRSRGRPVLSLQEYIAQKDVLVIEVHHDE